MSNLPPTTTASQSLRLIGILLIAIPLTSMADGHTLNSNQQTRNVKTDTHGIISDDCDDYHWALTSPLWQAELYLLDAFYAIGITGLNSTIFKESLRRLHKECKPTVSIKWFSSSEK
jgi:hypothetical protein